MNKYCLIDKNKNYFTQILNKPKKRKKYIKKRKDNSDNIKKN